MHKVERTIYEWYLGVAQFGSVLEWGSRGRKFDSCHPDQKNTCKKQVFFFMLKIIT